MVGFIISQSLIPNAFKIRSCPEVLLLTASAYFAPTILANSFSNSDTFGPLPHQPLLIDSAIDSISSSPPTGRRTGKTESRIFI